MAKGNWSKYKPRVRCRFCGAVIKGEVKRIDGYKPACQACYDKRNNGAGRE